MTYIPMLRKLHINAMQIHIVSVIVTLYIVNNVHIKSPYYQRVIGTLLLALL